MGHLRAIHGPVSAIDSKPRQRAWIYGASTNHVLIFDARLGFQKTASVVQTYQRDVNVLALSPSEYYLAAGCTEDWSLVYDVRKMEFPVYVFKHDGMWSPIIEAEGQLTVLTEQTSMVSQNAKVYSIIDLMTMKSEVLVPSSGLPKENSSSPEATTKSSVF
jgi:hypothetical protein